MSPTYLRRLATPLLAGVLAVSASLLPIGTANAGPAAQPDLALTHTMQSNIQTGEPFSFKLQLTNNGTAATENGELLEVRALLRPRHPVSEVETTNAKFTCTADNSQVEFGSGLPVAHIVCKTRYAFEPGESAVFTVHATAGSRPGPARLHARVDPDNLIAESDENNNIAATVFVSN